MARWLGMHVPSLLNCLFLGSLHLPNYLIYLFIQQTDMNYKNCCFPYLLLYCVVFKICSRSVFLDMDSYIIRGLINSQQLTKYLNK